MWKLEEKFEKGHNRLPIVGIIGEAEIQIGKKKYKSELVKATEGMMAFVMDVGVFTMDWDEILNPLRETIREVVK